MFLADSKGDLAIILHKCDQGFDAPLDGVMVTQCQCTQPCKTKIPSPKVGEMIFARQNSEWVIPVPQCNHCFLVGSKNVGVDMVSVKLGGG